MPVNIHLLDRDLARQAIASAAGGVLDVLCDVVDEGTSCRIEFGVRHPDSYTMTLFPTARGTWPPLRLPRGPASGARPPSSEPVGEGEIRVRFNGHPKGAEHGQSPAKRP